MKKNIDIGIIILNYNSYNDTINLVNSLQNQNNSITLEIVVVDNKSPNESVKHLKIIEAYKNVNLLETKSNLGYARGNNFGLNYLYNNFNAEFVTILNNDVSINDNLIFSKLIDEYNSIENCGFISPIEVDSNGTINSYCGRKRPSFLMEILNSFLLFTYLFPNISKYNIDIKKRRIKVDIIAGAFLFTKMKYFKQINFFDSGTFLFLEERILSKKVENSKREQFLITSINYLHQTSLSINKTFSGLEQAKIFNESLIYYTKNYNRFGSVKAFILLIFLKFKIFQFKIFYFCKNYFNK
jgi:GT2 family glycosyltransferase